MNFGVIRVYLHGACYETQSQCLTQFSVQHPRQRKKWEVVAREDEAEEEREGVEDAAEDEVEAAALAVARADNKAPPSAISNSKGRPRSASSS